MNSVIRSESSQRDLNIAMVLIAIVALGARLLSWPAFTTQDTIFVTAEAIAGEYTTYHPLLGALLIRVFAVPFGSYAVYGTLQVALAATLFMRALVITQPNRCSWRAVACALLWGLSIHTWLYMGMLWKDVLIAYSLIYLASLSYLLRSAGVNSISKIDTPLFAIALLFATELRHGMEINIVVVPIFIGLGRIVRIRKLRYAYLSALVAVTALTAASSSSIVRHDKDQQVHDLLLRLTVVSQPFLSITSNPNGYSTDDEGYDRRLAQNVFGPQYKADYRPDYYGNRIALSDPKDLSNAVKAISARVPRLCLLNLALCFSDRVQMLFSTLQPATRVGGMVFYDLGLQPCSAWPDLNAPSCEILTNYESNEKPEAARRLVGYMMDRLVSKQTLLRNLYVWNLFPALVFLALVLLFSGVRNRVWWIAVFYLGQISLPFLTAPVNDFRYYYFLPFFMYVFAPMLVGRAMRTCSLKHPLRATPRPLG